MVRATNPARFDLSPGFHYLCRMNTEHPLLCEALQRLQIGTLTPMQQSSLQYARDPRDLILLSPTGSGKTLAFLLPLLLSLRSDTDRVQVLILVPSRELALQVDSVFRKMTTRWGVVCCYGGHPIAEEKKSLLGTRPAVVVGTPGRILDHLSKGNLDAEGVATLVIDEFDKSLELGFQEEMAKIIDSLPALKRRMLISATDAEEIPLFTGIGRSIRLDFLQENGGDSRLQLRQVCSPAKDKLETLFRLLCTLGTDSSIVFCNHRDAVDRVSRSLTEHGLYNESFHGGMEQPDRERALYKFRNGSCQVLVATDLAARGLDIPEVGHIVHYHLPVSEEAFTHRNGRTARWMATGNSYLLLHPEETIPAYISPVPESYIIPEQIPRPVKPQWTTLYISKGKKDKLNKVDIAGLLYKKGNLSRDEVGQIDVKDHYAFVAVHTRKLNQLLTLIRGEKIKGMKVLVEVAE